MRKGLKVGAARPHGRKMKEQVAKALETVRRQREILERARKNIPFTGVRAITVANVLTYFDEALLAIENLLEQLSCALEKEVVKCGKGLCLVPESTWKVLKNGNELIIKREDPSLSITFNNSILIKKRKVEEKEEAWEVEIGGNIRVRRHKEEMTFGPTDYEKILKESERILRIAKETISDLMKRAPELQQHLKLKGAVC